MKLNYRFLLLFCFISLDAMQEDKKLSVCDGYRQQYEGRRKKWEDDRCVNTCGGIVYLPFCCFGCCFWSLCRRDYLRLRADARALRVKGIEVDDPTCPSGCGWCAACCEKNNSRVVPIGEKK